MRHEPLQTITPCSPDMDTVLPPVCDFFLLLDTFKIKMYHVSEQAQSPEESSIKTS